MSPQPRGSPTPKRAPAARRARPELVQLCNLLVRRRPPSTSKLCSGPTPGRWASPPKPMGTQSSASVRRLANRAASPRRSGPCRPRLRSPAPDPRGVVPSSVSLGPTVSDRGFSTLSAGFLGSGSPSSRTFLVIFIIKAAGKQRRGGRGARVKRGGEQDAKLSCSQKVKEKTKLN